MYTRCISHDTYASISNSFYLVLLNFPSPISVFVASLTSLHQKACFFFKRMLKHVTESYT